MLADRKLLIAGASCRQSIPFAVAERAQLMGAEVLLASSPGIEEEIGQSALGLPEQAAVVDIDRGNGSGGIVAEVESEIGWLDGILWPLVPKRPTNGGVTEFGALVATLEPVLGTPGPVFGSGGASLVVLGTALTQIITPLELDLRDLARKAGANGHRANLVLSESEADVSNPSGDLRIGGGPRSVADVICFLLSELSRSVTGGAIYADRGSHLAE